MAIGLTSRKGPSMQALCFVGLINPAADRTPSRLLTFGTTQVGNQPIYSRPATIGGNFSVTTAIHNGNTDSLYINGLLALNQGNKYASISGASSAATIGTGLNNSPFTGNLGETLIYNRALSNDERAVVERYLITKYRCSLTL